MPPNDYLILRNASRRTSLTTCARDRQAFTDMRCVAASKEQNEWNYIEAAAEGVGEGAAGRMGDLAVSRPAADTAAASRMRSFDAQSAGPQTS